MNFPEYEDLMDQAGLGNRRIVNLRRHSSPLRPQDEDVIDERLIEGHLNPVAKTLDRQAYLDLQLERTRKKL
ncbi:hypothetical protein AAVH_22806 [Aphelenchoides avenae]|nr:hypothetical protein AAVH_22806 [Aphelenchus avenae]